MNQSNETGSVSAQLGLWDAVSIIVGIVVGTAIFKTPQLVFSNVGGPWAAMFVWLLGGVLSLLGAMCYAELATTYPRSGGDYVYLTRAYGSWVGFLFGWAQLAVILTGSIGAMAYAFSDYALPLFDLDEKWGVWFAAGAIAGLTLLNLFGVILGKTTQNVLTVVKVLGVGGLIVAGLFWGGTSSIQAQKPMSGPGFGLAMVFVLYAYGGWNDAAFVAAEVRDRRRNIPCALILGTCGITVIYLLTNMAYLFGLGFEGVRSSGEPAADVLQKVLGEGGAKGMRVLVMISALGAANGLIFTGSRIYASLGSDHSVFVALSRWHPRFGVPVWSLLAQAAIALLLTFAVGTSAGRNAVDGVLLAIGFKVGLPWGDYFGGFNTLVAGTAPVFWIFFLLTGLSLFALRAKDPNIERPFRVPLYPFAPIIFCLMSVYMLYSSLDYAKGLALLGIVPLLIGLPLYFISQRMKPRS